MFTKISVSVNLLQARTLFLPLITVRQFDYENIRTALVNELYSPAAVASDLICANPTGASVSCPEGFCRSIIDGAGIAVYSSCVKKGAGSHSYGITVSLTQMSDFVGDQTSIIFACNKPMCNSKDKAELVRQLLASTQIIPKPTDTTTKPNGAVKLFNGEQHMVITMLLMFSVMVLIDF